MRVDSASKKIIPVALITGVALLATSLVQERLQPSAVPAPPAADQAPRNPMIVPCPDSGSEGLIDYEGKLVLNKAFLDPKAPVEEAVAAAVAEQIKFLDGLVSYSARFQGDVRMYPSAEKPSIRILGIRAGQYGRELIIDPIVLGTLDSGYLMSAYKRGFTKRSDPALIVRYRASFKAAVCSAAASQLKIPGLPLPYDPYLAFYLVKQEDRRPLKYNEFSAVTNPCGFHVMAMYRAPPLYFYAWNPEMDGVDERRKAFSCKTLLAPGTDYGIFRAGWSPHAAAAFRLFEPLMGKERLSMSLFLNTSEPGGRRFDPLKVRDLLAPATVKRFGAYALSALARASLEQPETDAGVLKFLSLLSSLDRVMSIERHALDAKPRAVVLNVSGTLKKSRRPIALRIYFGAIDVPNQRAPEHWPALADALAHDDVVFYSGHSGAGRNISLSRMYRDLNMSRSEARRAYGQSPYLFFAAASCTAYAYYGEDLLELRHGPDAPPARQTDLALFTGSFRKTELPLAVLSYLDERLSGASLSLSQAFSAAMTPDDAVVLKSIVGGR